MKMKFRYTKPIVSLFLAVAGLIFISTIVTILISERTFEKKFPFKAKFADANGLKANTPVYLKGFKIGKIKNIKLNIDNFVEADLEIFQEFRDKITINSLLYKSFGFITASTTIEFLPGPKGSPKMSEGVMIPAVDVPEGVLIRKEFKTSFQGDPLATFIYRIERLLEEFDISGESQNEKPLQQTLKAVVELSTHVNSISQNLDTILIVVSNGINKHGDALFETIDKLPILTGGLADLTVRLNKTLEKSNVLIENFAKPDSLGIKLFDPNGENLIKPLNKTIVGINAILPRLNELAKFSSNQTSNLTIIMERLKGVLSEIEKTFNNLNRSPILGSPENSSPKDLNNNHFRQKDTK